MRPNVNWPEYWWVRLASPDEESRDDRRAQTYDEGYLERLTAGWNRISFPIIASLVRPVLERTMPHEALDFGCGSGAYASILRATGARVEGCDISGAAVQSCSGMYDRVFSVAGSRDLAAGRYDLVFSSEVLEHIRDHRAALADFHRSLRPNGIVFLTTTAYGPSIFTMLYVAKNRGLPPLKLASYGMDWLRGYFSESQRDDFVREWCFGPLGGHFHGFIGRELLGDLRKAGFSIERHGIFYPMEPLQMPFLYSYTITSLARKKEWSAAKRAAAVFLYRIGHPLNSLLRAGHMLANNLFVVAKKN